jgi:group I intron endonuclease
MAKIGIYKITNPNNKIYIGQSTDVESRWANYKCVNCKQQPKLYNSLKKYGPNFHKFEIIEECRFEDLNIKEIFWGEKYNVLSNQNLNCRLGSSRGAYDSEETKYKKRLKLQGRKNEWLKGIPLTQEHKDRIGIAKQGFKYSQESKDKMSIAQKGISKTSHVESVIKSKSKPIIQYNLEGNFIAEYKSAAEASKILNLQQANINTACNQKYGSSIYKKFIWKYK